MKRTVGIAALLAVSWAWAGWGALAGGKTSAGDKDSAKGDFDKKFVMTAASSGMAEVKLGKLAQERGTSAAVKDFGKKMVKDHTKANKELLELCKEKGHMPSKHLLKKHAAAVEKLSKLEGAAFDEAYGKQMVHDHQEAIKLFQAETKNGTDEALKAFAAKTLPTLRKHLGMAKKLPGADGDKSAP